MSLKRSIVANYISQLYVTAIGILMVPLYLRYMGAEAYGLVGFFAMLQAWFNLLDVGLTPTVARETARYRGGAITALAYRQLFRALEVIFLAIAVLGGLALFLGSASIAAHWLKLSALSREEVRNAIRFMALIIAMRWVCGLYRGELSGSERLVWLGAFNSAFATLRFVGALPVLAFVSPAPTAFFAYQFGVAIVEIIVLKATSTRSLPALATGQRAPLSLSAVKPVLGFSLTIAFTSSVWVLVTQTDKLILSNILPLAEYGYFTLAVLVASGVTIISGPVSAAIMPRMTKLEAEGDHAGLLRVYRESTQLVAVLAGAASFTAALFAEPLLWAWTGDRHLAKVAAPVLALYALGNGVLGVAAFPYYLQYAKGDLRLHLIGNAVFVVVLIPAVAWAAHEYGSTGAGYAWLCVNLLSFVAWLPLVHRKFEPGLNRRWYGQDVLPIFAAGGVAAWLLATTIPQTDSRTSELLLIVGAGTATALAGAMAASFCWSHIRTGHAAASA